jgi:hypothetical protein
MITLRDQPESATRTLRRYNLEPTERAPEMSALIAMLQGHIADAAERASRKVTRDNAVAAAIDLIYASARG